MSWAVGERNHDRGLVRTIISARLAAAVGMHLRRHRGSPGSRRRAGMAAVRVRAKFPPQNWERGADSPLFLTPPRLGSSQWPNSPHRWLCCLCPSRHLKYCALTTTTAKYSRKRKNIFYLKSRKQPSRANPKKVCFFYDVPVSSFLRRRLTLILMTSHILSLVIYLLALLIGDTPARTVWLTLEVEQR